MPITNNLFRLTFPDTWKETTVYTFEGPHDSGVQHNLVLSVLPGLDDNVGLDAYAKNLTETSAGILPGFNLISEKPLDYFKDVPGFEIAYSYRPADEVEFHQKQWYFRMNDRVFLFTGTFSKKTMKTIGVEVEGIIRSLTTDLISRQELGDA